MTDLRIPEKRFRPEIEGVRVVAALLVAIYHIWIGAVSGGVDVFFIVSGYLITTSLLNRVEREGKIHLFEYILGLARRLFPLAFTVILTIAVFSFFLLPQSQWQSVISQIFSSALYFQNWELATNSVDYLERDNGVSPFQHFWALSIQGQFYITWPLIIFLSYLLARKIFKTPIRKTLLCILILLFATSLSYSIYITNVNQPWAYFDTFARVWEFSLGGILALLLPYIRLNRTISIVIGWLGLAFIALTGIILPVSDVFPGYAALLPTTSVILIIIAAENGSRFGVEKFLGSKPFLSLGSISYGFYLWHWPLLIFYNAYFNTKEVSLIAGLAIMVITLILSFITSKLLEVPVRKISVKKAKKKLIPILAAMMLPAFLFGIFWMVYVNQQTANISSYPELKNYPGAIAIHEGFEPEQKLEPKPSTLLAKEHLPLFYEDEDCFSYMNEDKLKMCSYGDKENPEYVVALVGGSHSGHWFPALHEIADDLNIQIDVYNKDACRFSADDFDGFLTESCMKWNEQVIEVLKEKKPDLVFTTANVGSGDKIPEGYLGAWKALEGVTEVFAIRDNPRMLEDIPLCIDEKGPEECSVPRDEALSEVAPWENTENIPDNVTFADLSDYFCNEDTCEPVIGNVLVYRDQHHLTTLYSQTLGPALKVPLSETLSKLK